MTQLKLNSKTVTNLMLNARVKSCFMRGLGLAGTIGLLGAIVPVAQAQVPLKMTAIDAPFMTGTTRTITTTNANPSNGVYPSGAANTINFGVTTSNDRIINTFSALDLSNNTQKFNFGGLLTNIYIRRNNVNFPNSNRQLAFFERSSVTDMVSSYSNDMETILRSSAINRGTDNTFANTGNSAGNNSNIERVDFITPTGLISPPIDQINDIGFLILERGGNDNIKVAAILSVDATGKPTSYGPIVSRSNNDWGKTGPTIGYSVMRKDVTDADWRPSDSNSGQQISGLYFSMGSLGVPPNTVIYGYSIIPHDVTYTNTNPLLLDWTNYPTGTTESGGSGLDLMAGGGIFVTHTIKGTVFSDPNASKVQDLPSEAGVSAGLKAILMDSLGNVIQVQSVASDGTYQFKGVATPLPGSPYTVSITTTTPAVNSVNPLLSLPSGYVSTGENKANTPDSSVDTRVTVTVDDFTPLAGQPSSGQPVLTEAVRINFGLQQLPTAVTTTIVNQPNPGGTTSVSVPPALFNTSTDPDGTVDKYRITSFPTNATSITVTQAGVTTTYTSANFPTTGLTILSSELSTLTVDPIDGAVNVTIPFKAIDNAGRESTNTANAIVPFTASANVSVSGTVFNDVNGTKLQDGTEPIVNGTTLGLNAFLVNSSNQVVANTTVSATGTYSFSNVAAGTYTVLITANPPSGTTPPAIVLPTNWTTTGENLNGIVETTPATSDSQITVTVASTNITNVNFGIEQLPTAIGTTATSQANPGGTTSVAVPVTLFNTSTDPDSGTVDSYRITSFPSNVTSLEIDGIVYTAAGGNGTTAFPTAGVTVLATKLNTIKVDPIDGAVNVTIPFKAIDNAGQESTNTANAIVPFGASLVSVSGTVFNDGNGNKLQAAGTEPSVDGTALGLKAVLVNSSNQVVATVPVSSTGTYTFNGVAVGDYTVLLTTNTPTGTTIPAIDLPSNWITTGENINNTIEPTADSKISVTVGSTPITGLNFGIEQLPTAIGTTASAQPNPRNAVSVDVPPALFNTSNDPDGSVDQYRITSFPSNATSITIDGIVYTPVAGPGTIAFPSGGVTIPASKINTIKVDPNVDGAVTVSIPFKVIDNFGQESTNTANAIVPFTTGNTPELILLKRITKINGAPVGKPLTGPGSIDLNQVVAQPDNPDTPRNESGDASNPKWPANYPKGAIDAGVVKSGDLVEYTIYFLSSGSDPVKNANFCDWVPKNTTFVENSYGLGRGIQLAIGSILNTFTNVPDGDRGVFYNPGATPPATYPNGATYKLNCMTPMGVDGAVVVNLVNNSLASPENQLTNATASGTPDNSYGFVRFVSKVK